MTGIDCVKNTLTELTKDLLYGRIITSSLFGFHLDIFDLFLTFSSFSLLFLFLKLYRTIIAGAFMNTSWENPSGHRAISYEENLTFTLSDFYQENLSFLYGKSFVQTQFFLRYSPLFYHSSVHMLFLFCTGFFCCSEEVVTELLSEY